MNEKALQILLIKLNIFLPLEDTRCLYRYLIYLERKSETLNTPLTDDEKKGFLTYNSLSGL